MLKRVLFQAEGTSCAKPLRQERERENLIGGGKKEDQYGLRIEKMGGEKQLAGDGTAGMGRGARQGRAIVGIWDNSMKSERS